MPERFRFLLGEPGTIELPGCFDALSALLIEHAGFPALFLSGYGVAASSFGNPDIGLTTVTETALVTKHVAGATRIPVVVDADNGYGNEDNVARTVYELEFAGAAALILEDQVFPKRCGHSANRVVIPMRDYMRKLEAAMNARRTPLVIVARTDSSPLEEAIARARSFHEAGADMVLIDGLSSADALRRVADEVPGHKVVNLIYGGKTPISTAGELGRIGFKMVLYSTPALYAAAYAMRRTLERLKKTGTLASLADESFTFPEFQSFIELRYLSRPYRAESAGSRKDDA
jgi:2-methylisocitrate lyase-like PEP mutase family enzyme